MILVFLSISASSSCAEISDQSIHINVNGSRILIDTEPFIKRDRILVPLRGIFENLGADVSWDADKNEVYIKYKETNIILKINSRYANLNGEIVKLGVEAELSNNRTMIPLRFVSESIGMLVGWVPEARLATITDSGYLNNNIQKVTLGFTTKDFLGDKGSYDSLIENKATNFIAAFSYCINATGDITLSGESQIKTIKYSLLNNIKPLLVIHNYTNTGFDKDIAHEVLTSDDNRHKLAENILIEISEEGYSGINIDIENVYPKDRSAYTAFIKELKEKLSPFGFITTVSVPAKTYDSYLKDNWGGAFDYSEIGKYADKIVIMTYDEHYFGGDPGPVASFPWVEKVIKYATTQMAPEKLLLGVGLYGYDWSGKSAKVVLYKNVNDLNKKVGGIYNFDNTLKSPQLKYTKDGIFHEVWYENKESVTYKLGIVNKYKLGGIAIWRLGYDNEEFWNQIKLN
jgi:spore germination protein YaaH